MRLLNTNRSMINMRPAKRLKYETYQNAAKLITYLQLVLETMDSLKGTRLYKQEVKFFSNNLMRVLEEHIKGPAAAFDEEEFGQVAFNRMQLAVEVLNDLRVAELVQFAEELQKFRENVESLEKEKATQEVLEIPNS